MVEYRLEGNNADRNVIELRTVMDAAMPTIEGRNPGNDWREIAWFNDEGLLILCEEAGQISGLAVDDSGRIKIRPVTG